ncbi:MAG: hypothetical protein AAFR62_15015, partial [Cyanobacteria bacterium J06629_2]
ARQTNNRQRNQFTNDCMLGDFFEVDEVYDVVDIHPEELKPVPVAMSGTAASYFRGIADYQNQTLNVINLTKLLAEDGMTVELTA